MFERYTEAARRAVFYARYEAAKCGSAIIETEHLLLGVLHQDHDLALRLFGSEQSVAALEAQISSAEAAVEASTAVDLPLSQESKRVLAYGAEEAERLGHRHVGTAHLVLGLLREPDSRAAQALAQAGAELARFREQVAGPSQGNAELHRLIDELPPEQWEAAEQALRSLISGSQITARGSLTSSVPGESWARARASAAPRGPFERYTEQARRIIFFARYEASQFGANSIESEHLLLALLREYPPLLDQLHSRGAAVSDIRKEIEQRKPPGPKTPTSVDIPLSKECERALTFAADEARQMKHRQIGNAHLLVGLLREEGCLAAELLRARGIDLEEARKNLTQGANT